MGGLLLLAGAVAFLLGHRPAIGVVFAGACVAAAGWWLEGLVGSDGGDGASDSAPDDGGSGSDGGGE